jgi:hypothetical protein
MHMVAAGTISQAEREAAARVLELAGRFRTGTVAPAGTGSG